MRRKYRLTQRAKKDFTDIGRYTKDNWGKAKRNDYLNKMALRFAFLTSNPRLGKLRNDIAPNVYCFPEGQHLIFYTIQAAEIRIVGIPHRNMDISKFFNS
ncbi:type II toxin-antitoxin system RelE/ParE family toxin [Rhizobium sp.]|uniref:type II toxin-antitoxin system RelE/ParE family toxin n=1 Tax=Rhizobium sp. TaxID=391 RepID=UPI002EE37BEB